MTVLDTIRSIIRIDGPTNAIPPEIHCPRPEVVGDFVLPRSDLRERLDATRA